MKKSAFTLIELLVVIAIIAILASLAIPALSGAIERARALTDANQLKSLGTMFLRYLSEHDDQMPSLAGAGSGDPWPKALHKMVPDYKVFLSPFDKRKVTDNNDSPVSYGVNSNNYDVNASDFTAPSQLIMMAPDATLGQGKNPKFNGTAGSNISITPGGSCGVYKNGTMLNVLFADWHVVPMNFATEFSDTGSSKGKKHWMPKYSEGEN